MKGNYRIGVIHRTFNTEWCILTYGIFYSDNPFMIESTILNEEIKPISISVDIESIKNKKTTYLQYKYMEPIIFNVKNVSDIINVKKIEDLQDLNLLCNILFNCVLINSPNLNDFFAGIFIEESIVDAFRKNNFLRKDIHEAILSGFNMLKNIKFVLINLGSKIEGLKQFLNILRDINPHNYTEYLLLIKQICDQNQYEIYIKEFGLDFSNEKEYLYNLISQGNLIKFKNAFLNEVSNITRAEVFNKLSKHQYKNEGIKIKIFKIFNDYEISRQNYDYCEWSIVTKNIDSIGDRLLSLPIKMRKEIRLFCEHNVDRYGFEKCREVLDKFVVFKQDELKEKELEIKEHKNFLKREEDFRLLVLKNSIRSIEEDLLEDYDIKRNFGDDNDYSEDDINNLFEGDTDNIWNID